MYGMVLNCLCPYPSAWDAFSLRHHVKRNPVLFVSLFAFCDIFEGHQYLARSLEGGTTPRRKGTTVPKMIIIMV